jgi:hypothetical protein
MLPMLFYANDIEKLNSFALLSGVVHFNRIDKCVYNKAIIDR